LGILPYSLAATYGSCLMWPWEPPLYELVLANCPG